MNSENMYVEVKRELTRVHDVKSRNIAMVNFVNGQSESLEVYVGDRYVALLLKNGALTIEVGLKSAPIVVSEIELGAIEDVTAEAAAQKMVEIIALF